MRHRFHGVRLPPPVLIALGSGVTSTSTISQVQPKPTTATGTVVKVVLAALVVVSGVCMVVGGPQLPAPAAPAPQPLVTLTSPPASYWVKPVVKRAKPVQSVQPDDPQAFDDYLVDEYLARLPKP